MAFKKDLTGQKIDKVLIIRYSHNEKGYSMWVSKCDCGNEFVLRGVNFTRGLSTSCGCNRRGHRTPNVGHPLYKVWLSLRNRCNNPNAENYKYYGGRGIKCCKRWDDYETFFSDVIDGYKHGLELDRYPNQDGDYEPNNFRWATHTEQIQNSSCTKLIASQVIEIRLSNKKASELASIYNISKDAIWDIRKYKTWKNI